MVVRARLKSFDWSIVEASADLGASALTTFRRVTLPVILPAVVAGALLAFTLSVDEFIIAFFTAGAGRSSTTLPMQIYAMIRFGITPEINALATIVMAVSVTALTLSQRLNRGHDRAVTAPRTLLSIDRVTQALRARDRRRRRLARHPRERVLRAARPLRLRQDHAAPPARRVRDAGLRAASCSTASTSRRSRRTGGRST